MSSPRGCGRGGRAYPGARPRPRSSRAVGAADGEPTPTPVAWAQPLLGDPGVGWGGPRGPGPRWGRAGRRDWRGGGLRSADGPRGPCGRRRGRRGSALGPRGRAVGATRLDPSRRARLQSVGPGPGPRAPSPGAPRHANPGLGSLRPPRARASRGPRPPRLPGPPGPGDPRGRVGRARRRE